MTAPFLHLDDPPKPAQVGGSGAFAAIYAEHFPFVWRILRGLGVPESGLEDAAQDVFVVVHRRLGDFRGEAEVRTWLFGIARNVAFNHRRAARRRGHPEPLDPDAPSASPGPHEFVESNEAAKFVEAFLARVDDKKREVFVLGVLEQLSMPEVARALGIELNTAYSRLRRVKAEFQRAIARAREGSWP